jgi:hypothetical protein
VAARNGHNCFPLSGNFADYNYFICCYRKIGFLLRVAWRIGFQLEICSRDLNQENGFDENIRKFYLNF